jgi:hypothetical protein
MERSIRTEIVPLQALTQKAIIESGCSLEALVKLRIISENVIYRQVVILDFCSKIQSEFLYYDGKDFYLFKYIQFCPESVKYRRSDDTWFILGSTKHAIIPASNDLRFHGREAFVKEQDFSLLKPEHLNLIEQAYKPRRGGN